MGRWLRLLGRSLIVPLIVPAGIVVGALAGCAGLESGPGFTSGVGAAREEMVRIPLDAASGGGSMVARVCRPAGDLPGWLVVIAHGSPPDAARRPGMTPTSCSSEAAQWFLARGAVVVAAMRRGYGATGGVWAEGTGGCTVEGYERAALESARDIAATVSFGLALPYVRHEKAVVVGQSAGGWGTLGLNAVVHPDVVALVSMAGGRGGHVGNRANENCRPDNLVGAAGRLGRTAGTPMLWVYAANDSYFAPELALAMHAAYVRAGGEAQLEQVGGFGSDGHSLFFGRGGSSVWAPPMERYLRQQGAT